MIDRARYVLGVLTVIVLPPGLLFWLVIHPWARWWRRLGPRGTYGLVLPVMVAFAAWLFRIRGPLLAADLGTNWWLIAGALALYSPVTVLELRYWRHLSIPTLIGIPEVSRTGERNGTLLRDGIYRVVRHPRYLSAGLGMMGNALIVNHVGLYLLILWVFPAGYLMALLEERELVDRLGEAYRQYQRKVPRLIPRWRETRVRRKEP